MNNMKKSLHAGLAWSALAGGACASIPVGLGDLSFDATATATYDSNVFGSSAATSDYFGTFTPNAIYERKAGEIEAQANAGIAFERYARQTRLNANNVNADAALRVEPDASRNFSGALTTGYHETSDVDSDVNARIRAKTGTASGKAALVTGPKTDFAFGADYTDIRRNIASDQRLLASQLRFDYKDFLEGYSLRLLGNYDEARSSGKNLLGADLDQNSYTGAVGLGHAFYHNVIQAGVSYGYRVLNRSREETTTGQTRLGGPVMSASLEGPFLPARYFPKIKSSLSLTYDQATTPGVNNAGGRDLTGALSLDWQARSTTRASFSATRSQRLSADDLTVVSTAVQLGIEQTLRYNLTGSASAGYDWDTFRGIARADEGVLANAALKYSFAHSWGARASYRFTNRDSTLAQSSYQRHLAELSVNYQF